MTEFKLADTVLMRLVQIIQEAMITGVDCVDVMRMIRLQEGDEAQHSARVATLTLTPQYVQQVKEGYDRMLVQAEQLKEQTQLGSSVDPDSHDNN